MGKVEVGQSVRRTEDYRFLTGQGSYIDDMNLVGQAYGVVVRSQYAHADIKGIDIDAASEMPGVLLIVTPDDWAKAGYGPIPTKSGARKNRDGSDFSEPPRHCFAMGRVRYVGEPVAFVVAETLDQAKAAAEMVDVDYDELAPVIDPVAALTDAAPQIWKEAPNNLCLDFGLGDEEGCEAAFKTADHVISLDMINNRVTAVPIETRGCLGSYDPETESFTLWNSSQNIHANRDQFAGDALKIEKTKLHHIAPDVGGGFGAKNSAYPEPPMVLHAARELGRPVKWVNSRSESFLSDTHGRGQVSRVTLALSKEGKFLALKTDTVGGIGAYAWTVGPFTPTGGSARTQGGPYHIPAIYYRGRAVFTNTMSLDPYRGAGRPEGSFHVERIIEYAARKLGFDPIELRRQNLMPPEMLPYKSPTGLDIDSGDFPFLFEETLRMSEAGDVNALKAKAEAKGRAFGFAISPYLECTGGGPKEHAGVTFNADGSVDLAVGSQSTGMGHETALAQLLAADLGLDMETVRYTQADTDATPIGGGHGGSRGLEVGGNAVRQAAEEIIDKAVPLAARLLQSEPGDVAFEDGHFTAGTASVAMADVIDASFDLEKLPDGMEPGCLNHATVFERGVISIPNGCHAAAVEVDTETGTVDVVGYWVMDDFGPILNPLLADGQVMGGVAQGIGQALMEEIVYDPETGQLVTGSLMDYGLPRADTIPQMDIGYYEGAPTAKNPLGVKGAGEAGCVGACPTVVNAVLDALKEKGVTHIDMPLTPQKVWRAIQANGAFDETGLLKDVL